MSHRVFYKPRYGTSRALVIGIDRYVSAPGLGYAVNDAQGVHDVLCEHFDFRAENMALLINEQASRQSIMRAMTILMRESDYDDRIIVFFAGHGHTLAGSKGDIGFLVPYEGEPDDPATLIRWKELVDATQLMRAKHVLFLMDACYSGLAVSRHAQAGATRFLKDMLIRHSRQVLTAGKANEAVADQGGPLPGHSIFTGHLIEGLLGKAEQAGKVMTASGLMAYVYRQVGNDPDSAQTPHYGHVDGDGDFILRGLPANPDEMVATEGSDVLMTVPYADDQSVPLGRQNQTARIKELLASDSGAIQAHDLAMAEVRRFLTETSEDAFVLQEDFSKEALAERLERYEAATRHLVIVAGCLAYWGRSAHRSTLQKSVARATDRLGDRSGGLEVWLHLRWYPIVRIVYAAGIAAVDAGQLDNLAALLATKVVMPSPNAAGDTLVDALGYAIGDLYDAHCFETLPGHERQHVPLSEYLYVSLQPELDDAFFLGMGYEAAFEAFEVLLSCVIADRRLQNHQGYGWWPAGRFGYKARRRGGPWAGVLAEAKAQGAAWSVLRAGLFGGSMVRFDAAATMISEGLARGNY